MPTYINNIEAIVETNQFSIALNPLSMSIFALYIKTVEMRSWQ